MRKGFGVPGSEVAFGGFSSPGELWRLKRSEKGLRLGQNECSEALPCTGDCRKLSEKGLGVVQNERSESLSVFRRFGGLLVTIS